MSKRTLSTSLVVGALCAVALGGCTSAGTKSTETATTTGSAPTPDTSRRPTPRPEPIVGTPPAGDGPTLLVVAATTGSRTVGKASVAVGDLWLTGRCDHGTLKLHIEPLAVLPVPCDDLAGAPFANQIVIDTPATYRIRVEAPSGLTWNLRVEQ